MRAPARAALFPFVQIAMRNRLKVKWWRMIKSIQLLRNIGLFDSVSAGANISLARLTLVYAENGRGKTTLAAILRSLATGDPIPIAGRRRLAGQDRPHVVLECDGGHQPAMFQNNAWNRTVSNLVVCQQRDESIGLRIVYGIFL